ncbi:MAG: hypothetical protein IPF46_06835 [Saprospiraceae bacterium]|nr:hypothetical protein [Candidatus Vicinibacter affinis]
MDYLLNYPSGKHIENAQQQIEYFKRQRTQKNEERNQIIDKLRTNPNSFTPSMLRTHLDDNKITKNDLLNAGIPIEIINRLDNTITPELKLGETPNSIPEGYTEVYFWGNPGSGKTCALAAVLSTAYKMGYLEIDRARI